MDRWKLLLVLVAGLSLVSCGGGSGGGGDGTSSGDATSEFTVSTSAGSGGAISPESTTVSAGGRARFNVSPDLGYKVSTIRGCGGTFDGSIYTTGPIAKNCQVTVTFELAARAVPTAFAIDFVNRRLIGQAPRFPAGQKRTNPFVVWGLDNSSYEIIPVPDDFPYYGLYAFDDSRNEVILPSYLDGHLNLTAFDLDSRAQRLLLGYSLNLDPTEWSGARITDIKMSPDNTSLYLMLIYVSATGDWAKNNTVILRYDLAADRISTVINGYTQSGAKVSANSFTLADDGFLVIGTEVPGAIGGDGRLRLIDYQGQDIKEVSEPIDLLPDRIDIAEGSSTAYVVGYDGIAKVNIDNGTQQVISLEKEELFFNVARLGAVFLDTAGNRLLVGDYGFDYIFAMDRDTGSRTEFAASSVGEGKRLIWPRAIELDEGSQRAFVLDDGGYSGEVLVEIDLVTGDRTVLTRFNLFCRYVARDLILDLDGGRLFAVFENAAFEVSLNDGNFTRLDSSDSGACGGSYRFGGGSLDAAANRLLLTDKITDSVLAFDLATKAVTSIHSSAVMDNPADVELDVATGLLYILSQGNGELHSYDPATGIAAVLLDSCPENGGDTNIDWSHGLALDPSNPWIWISGNELMRYDVEAKTCEVMPWRYVDYELGSNIHILDAKATNGGQLYGTKINNVVQIDFASGELITISR
ncbi:hypothetical protein [Microbulbifer yueqingensis]|uniref:LVIVD repeat-containing protein n=1 Tax=Microbulbifer yueqingensis TaxID=658219 RepID=A0A1G9BGB4_9GAMM|nr:hypothetical protein [Microbulbifer yueqingensis]SDK38094.1 hypothetical protein SAMN05216212_2219 [Microbulbifer yueqingensis]